MVDEFRRIYGSAAARYAILASARNIYLEAPFGPRGFYPRLCKLQPLSLFVWGNHDSLVPAAFGRHVRKWLPRAEQLTIDECGHVPQVEYPAETSQLLMDFSAGWRGLGLLWLCPPVTPRRPTTQARRCVTPRQATPRQPDWHHRRRWHRRARLGGKATGAFPAVRVSDEQPSGSLVGRALRSFADQVARRIPRAAPR
jgi:hypothetical protein